MESNIDFKDKSKMPRSYDFSIRDIWSIEIAMKEHKTFVEKSNIDELEKQRIINHFEFFKMIINNYKLVKKNE